MPDAVPEISIVMPAYNEEANLAAFVERCVETLRALGRSGEVVITNDGSTDGTGAVLDALAREYPEVRPLHSERNGGYGAALGRALRESRGELVATIDSDGQFDIRELTDLLERWEPGLDVLTGYRRAKQDTPFRVFADRALNLLVRAMFGLHLRDTNCAFKLLRGDLARTLELESRGFSTPTEILLRCQAAGHRIAEAPVSHAPRPGGMSSLHPVRTGVRFLLFLIYFRLKVFLGRQGIIHPIRREP